MGRVKDAMMRVQDEVFLLELGYQEWLMENDKELSELEIDTMEADFRKSTTAKNHIISEIALNNSDYNPFTDTGA